MTANSEHHRRSIRLKDYDYTQARAYYVTIVVQGRGCTLGTITNGDMHLNMAGEIVQAAWEDLPRHYPHVVLGEFCVMPNHVHGIIILTDDDYRTGGSCRGGSEARPYPNHPTTRHGLPEIVRAFKSFSARRINQLRRDSGSAFWQRNYYEHIIRNAAELERISAYIRHNPSQWDRDTENPDVASP